MIILLKIGLETLVIPTAETTNDMTVKFFPETILLLKWIVLKHF